MLETETHLLVALLLLTGLDWHPRPKGRQCNGQQQSTLTRKIGLLVSTSASTPDFASLTQMLVALVQGPRATRRDAQAHRQQAVAA